MKLTVMPGLILSLTLLASACGQLPPSEADRFARERTEAEARNRQSTAGAVSNYRFKSTGSVDLEYVATLNKESQVFTFQITRRNGEPKSQFVPLVRADQPTLFDALSSVFAGEVSPTGSKVCVENCDSIPELRLTRVDGSISEYSNPALFTAAGGSANNLITLLTTFILNRL